MNVEVSHFYGIAFQYNPFKSMDTNEQYAIIEELDKASSMQAVPEYIQKMYREASRQAING